ncbi:MAG: murein biosynthesis integral membrane protein MurJ [Deltaproteobacteria bacterium]
MKEQRLARSVAINLVSRFSLGIFGFLQIILIAKAFGVSASTDAFLIASWIIFIFWSIGDTVLTYSLVPHLINTFVNSGLDGAKKASDGIFFWFCIMLAVFTLSVYLGSEYIIYLLAPGFSENAHVLTAELLRWLTPAIFLGGLSAFFSSLLFTVKRFTVPAIAALFPDFGAIGFLLFGADQWGIKAVVFGLLIGFVFQVIALFFALFSAGLLPRFRRSRFDEFKGALRLIGPRLGSVGVNRAIIGVDRFFASQLGAGSVSALTYSYRLTQMPVLMAIEALGKTIMPGLAKDAAQGRTDKLRKFIPTALGYILFGLAPMVLILIYYDEQIIRLLYERGSFTPEDTVVAARVLVWYAVAIVFASVSMLLSGIFFATGDTLTPFKISCVSLFLNAAMDYILMRFFGITGIAMATVCVAVVSMCLLYYNLDKKVGGIEISHAMGSFFKIAAATVVMGVTIWAMTTVSARLDFGMQKIMEMAVLSFMSWVAFLVVCRFLKLEEYLTVAGALGRKLGWQK